jgi:hypothetical protein
MTPGQKIFQGLLKPIILGGFVTGIIFAIIGIKLLSLNSNGTTTFSFFGQTFSSGNVGIAALFISATMIIIVIRRSLNSIDRFVSAIDSKTVNALKWPDDKSIDTFLTKLESMSHIQRSIFREIFLGDPRVNGKIFSDFFKVRNKINGIGRNYPHKLQAILKLERDQIVYRCKDLQNEKIIDIQQLTDYHYQLTKEVVDLGNKYGLKILEELYSNEERENYIPEVSYGANYKDNKPYFYFDADNKPLDGKYKFSSDGDVHNFRNGEIVQEGNSPN